MDTNDILKHILDSWNKPVIFVDTTHVIRYLNSPAETHYAKWGSITGKSIFHCHNETSCERIRAAYEQLVNGEAEVLMVNNEKHRVYMRGIRNEASELIGYIERYDPPMGS